MNRRHHTPLLGDAGHNVLPGSPTARLVSRDPAGIGGTETLAEAARRMRVEGVSALLVDGGAAIVTERDISRGIGAGVAPDEPVSTVATPHPITVDGELPVVQCAGIMLNEQLRHVVVAMPGASMGVVSLRDIASVLVQNLDPGLWLPPLRATRGEPSEIWLG